jgi:hypothetical protein
MIKSILLCKEKLQQYFNKGNGFFLIDHRLKTTANVRSLKNNHTLDSILGVFFLNKETRNWYGFFVRQRRFELPSPFRRYHLKVVRLPISPSPQWRRNANVNSKAEYPKSNTRTAKGVLTVIFNPLCQALPNN